MGSQRKVTGSCPRSCHTSKWYSLFKDSGTGATSTPRLGVYKHVGTWVSSAASPQRDISHKVAGATTGYPQAVSTVFSKKQYTRELRIRAMQALVESRVLSNAGGWADVTLSQMAKLESVRSRVLRKMLECFLGKETSVSDEKIRKMAKVPPVFVLVMARRLQLAARISRRAPPALFALLQRDRSPWKRQVLLDLCRLRDSMPEKLGTLPPPAVEPEAWERLWKAYPRSWKQLLRAFVKKMATGTEKCCFSARSGMCIAVSEYTDLEFLCPSCPAGAKTWPTRGALRSHMMSKHGWRNPWRQFVAGSCCPVCQKQFHTRARAVDHMAHRAERCRQAIQQDPDLFPKLETDIQGQLDQQDQQERRKAVKQWKSWLTAFLPAVSCKPNCP